MRPLLMVLLVLGVGCGPPTPAEQCRRVIAVTCKKLFECVATQAATLYGDEANCRSVQDQKLQCAKAQASCDIDQGKFDKCLSDTASASCSATGQPASCATAEICKTSGGTVCSGVSASLTGGSCTFTLDECSDGNSYAVRCATSGSSCSCLRNGTETTTFSSSVDFCADSTTAKSAMNLRCNWNLR